MISPVAVLIPVFNDQDGLNRTLKSVIRKVGGPLTVMVVDDGSDPPVKVALFGDDTGTEILLVRSEQNRGIEAALNLGLEQLKSRGVEFVARLDAGDLIVGDRLERQAGFLNENPDVALVASYVQFDDLEGHMMFVHRPPVGAREIRRALHLNNCLVHTSVMFRLGMVFDVGAYSTEFPAAEDYELFVRLAKAHPVDVIPEVLVRSELNPQGISLRRRRVQLKSRFRIQLRYFDFLEPASYLGLMTTVLFLFVPASTVNWVKSLRNKATVVA